MSTQTPKQIAASQRRSIKAMRAKLLDMSGAWEEVDQYCVEILVEAADKLLDVHTSLLDQIAEG